MDNKHGFPQLLVIYWIQQRKPLHIKPDIRYPCKIKNEEKHIILCKALPQQNKQKIWHERSQLNIKPRIVEKESTNNSLGQYRVKLSRLCIGDTRLTHGYLMSRNFQQPMHKNAECRNQRLTVKDCLEECLHWRDNRKSLISTMT